MISQSRDRIRHPLSVGFALLSFWAIAAATLLSQPSGPKEYPDGHGGVVEFPLGDLSFADEIVSFEPGEPRAAEANSRPQTALGIPDYDETDDTYVTLGCGGTLTLRFADNALVDVPGPDLYVFEIGPAVEAMDLAISADGNEWIEVGEISGGRADVDIAPHIGAGGVFHFVRLTDLKADCRPNWPGADVDAVGAIGAAVQFSLSGAVLFDSGQWELKPAAEAEIDQLARKIAAYPKGRVVIEGHTDNVGAPDVNQTLSQNRAGAVLKYMQAAAELSAFSFSAEGFGETRPAATNTTAEGRVRNRRVDVVLIPGVQ